VINWLKKQKNDGGGDLVPRSLISTHSVPEYESTLVPIQEIEWKLDSEKQSNREVKKQFEENTQSIHDSMDVHGMRWPIILKEGDSTPYKCYIGNDRVAYAVKNGYTHISSIVVDNSTDKLKIVQRTRQIDALEGFTG